MTFDEVLSWNIMTFNYRCDFLRSMRMAEYVENINTISRYQKK